MIYEGASASDRLRLVPMRYDASRTDLAQPVWPAETDCSRLDLLQFDC